MWSSCIPLLRIFSVDLVFLQASAILGRTDSHPPWSLQLVLGGGVELTQRAVELGFIAQGRLVRVSIETAQPEQRNNSIMSSTTSLLEEIAHFQEEDKKWKDDGNFETRKTMQIHFRYARPDRPRTGSSCGGTVPRRCWRRIVGKSGGRRSETTSRGHSDLFSLNAGGARSPAAAAIGGTPDAGHAGPVRDAEASPEKARGPTSCWECHRRFPFHRRPGKHGRLTRPCPHCSRDADSWQSLMFLSLRRTLARKMGKQRRPVVKTKEDLKGHSLSHCEDSGIGLIFTILGSRAALEIAPDSEPHI